MQEYCAWDEQAIHYYLKTYENIDSAPSFCLCSNSLSLLINSCSRGQTEHSTQRACLQSAALITADNRSHHLLEKESSFMSSQMHSCLIISRSKATAKIIFHNLTSPLLCASSESDAWTAVVLTSKVFHSQLQPSYQVLSMTEWLLTATTSNS